jgi:hypothetical protein
MDTLETYQCAGFALLLVEDESTSVINGALVGVLVG